ncbi:unnamed protein product [Brachionus calyciflorus]|uniref:Uncharacterized protein n=1 Tax=Brachionus calyciflorus TaxID=104777 RepID=A0A814M2Y7_9BILA|nr:unnamed protein product [Brachionus calyciflorus]
MIKTENTIKPSLIHLKEEELNDKNGNIQVKLTDKKAVVTESIYFKKLMNLSTSNESVTDLTPRKNMDIAFKIELLNPNQIPITTKSRPLPYHLKQKIKDELDRQLREELSEKEANLAQR